VARTLRTSKKICWYFNLFPQRSWQPWPRCLGYI
jgi:hypothetical protein